MLSGLVGLAFRRAFRGMGLLGIEAVFLTVCTDDEVELDLEALLL